MTGWSLSSTALMAAPPASSTTPATSLLAAPFPGPSRGGGAVTGVVARGGGGAWWWFWCGPQHQPVAMFTGPASPCLASWTPPVQPIQPPTWPGRWDQAMLAQSFSTMGLTSLVSAEWITDLGASFHTTPDAGILSSIHPTHPSCPPSNMVGNGSCLPVTFVGTVPGTFRLPNVHVAPQMVHNLLSIHQFTVDNLCYVEFNSSSLIVKDSASRCPLLRCDSIGPLYNPTSLLPLLHLRLHLR